MTGFQQLLQIIYMTGTKCVTSFMPGANPFGQEKITIGVTQPRPGFFVYLFAR